MLKKIYLLIFLFASIFIFSQSNQNDDPINEGFESLNFPPNGWFRVNVSGTNFWERSTLWAHTGNVSAFINYESNGGEDWLITPRRYVNTGDSISLWVRKYLQNSYPPDSLIVKASITDSAITSFQHTLIKIDVAYLPPSTWVKYSASLNAIAGNYAYFGFQHKELNGNGCFIDDVTITGTGIVGIEEKNNIPKEIILYQNYPNPFNPVTVIKFEVPFTALINLKVYDVTGREMMTLIDRDMNPGIYESSFDASQLSSGIYFYSLYINNDIIDTKKMVVGK